MHEKKQGKFLDGFFWGAVIGGGFAYLLSTQKGRDFLKEIIQNGVDAFENVITPEPETLEDISIIEQSARTKEAVVDPSVVEPADPKLPTYNSHIGEQGVKKTRFFKKSPKK